MPYLEFIVNPDSFAQTVENVFYFSFLVKEGKVAIEIDDTEGSPNQGDAICCQSVRSALVYHRCSIGWN